MVRHHRVVGSKGRDMDREGTRRDTAARPEWNRELGRWAKNRGGGARHMGKNKEKDRARKKTLERGEKGERSRRHIMSPNQL